MIWTARGLFLLLVGLLLWLAQARTVPPAEPGLAFKDDWPAPDEDSIDYLKTIDLRTLAPRDADRFLPAQVDLYGEALPPGASGRLCYPWGVARLAISTDGLRVATAGPPCSARAVEVFDAATGRVIRRMGAYRAIVEAIALSADGKRLAVARSDLAGFKDLAGNITVYDLETFDELLRFGEGTGPRTLAFAADGTLVSGGGDGMMWVWDVETGTPLRKVADLTRKVIVLALSPDGKQLATSSDDMVRIWDFASGAMVQQLQQSPESRQLREKATALAWSPDGQHLATNHGLWHLPTGQELPRFRCEEQLAGVAFSADGRTLARVGNGEISLRELQTGQVRRHYKYEDHSHGNHRQSIAFIVDGRQVLTGQAYGEGLIWNVSGLEDGAPLPRLSDIAALLAQLGDSDADRAYTAMWKLSAAGPLAVPLLAEQLRQPDPAATDPKRIAQLLADLDSNSFDVRDRATHALEVLGSVAEKDLRALLADRPALEVRTRADLILKRIGDRGGKSAQELLRLRGVEALEWQASDEARHALRELARHAGDPSVRDDARRSLDRLADQ